MVYGIILAAGDGKRLGMDIPKALVNVKNIPIFIYPLLEFSKNKKIQKIVVVYHPKYLSEYKKYVNKYLKNRDVILIEGNLSNRQGSLINAINYLKNNFKMSPSDVIVTHDCARINVSNNLIDKTILTAKKYGYSTLAVKSNDSLYLLDKKPKYLNRDAVYKIQTPQTFLFKYWKNNQTKNTTDLFTYLNLKLTKNNLVSSSLKNFKITSKEDLKLFE